jgi:predicted nucleic acid-binding protein
VIDVAATLGRRSAFDAAYGALARSLDAELWALDGPLARNAVGQKLLVRLIGSHDEDVQETAAFRCARERAADQEYSPPT